MRYSMMQLLLASRHEGTLLAAIPARQSRQDYIKDVFSKEIRFEHYGRAFVFEPFASPVDDKIVGVLGKEDAVTVAGPPEQKFAAHDVSNWDTANVLIDTSGASEGQKAAMQGKVGSPPAIFRTLVDHINTTNASSSDWLIEVNPITTSEEFWTAAERYRGHISEIDLTFAVPNIWGAESETEKALREFKEKNNAQEVEVKIKNRDGKINPDSERVRESVDYIAKGGGVSQIKDESQAVVFSSDAEQNAVTIPVEPDPPIQESQEADLRNLIRQIFGML
jgi:hypothetical protein